MEAIDYYKKIMNLIIKTARILGLDVMRVGWTYNIFFFLAVIDMISFAIVAIFSLHKS